VHTRAEKAVEINPDETVWLCCIRVKCVWL